MLDRSFSAEIQQRIDQKTKPLGALGQLERVAHHLALIQSQNQRSSGNSTGDSSADRFGFCRRSRHRCARCQYCAKRSD